MVQEPYLKVNNLSYQVNEIEILKDISFSLGKGDILVIIGPNGSGKTTLLKAIIGAIKPTKGEVKIMGKNIKHFWGKIAYVPQKSDFDRLTPITVREFMSLENCGKKEHGTQNISDALSEVGLKGEEKKKLGVLSGGEFQRLMIARALLHEKEFLIFDEPAAGIDSAGEETIYSLISTLNKKRNTTSLIVSHELSVVSRYADNVLCLNKSLVCFGPPKQAINTEVLNKLYGTDSSIYTHNH